jgi:hypothetical protein
MKIIRNWDGKTHGGLASRQHAAAMKIEILTKVMAWSEREARQCQQEISNVIRRVLQLF